MQHRQRGTVQLAILSRAAVQVQRLLLVRKVAAAACALRSSAAVEQARAALAARVGAQIEGTSAAVARNTLAFGVPAVPVGAAALVTVRAAISLHPRELEARAHL